jgi:sec-independent protein translocase protein TatB
MFDFAWSEIALIAAVALIAIGPKDMPVAIRTVSGMVKKARKMAAEFQTHVDEMVKEANLDEVRNQFNQIRNFDIKGEIEKTIDADGSLRDTFASNPMDPMPFGAETTVAELTAVPAESSAASAETVVEPAKPMMPAFIPPNLAPPPEPVAANAPPEPPAFIPPAYARAGSAARR